MAELEFNIARLQQCLDVTVGTPSVGDVVQVTSTSPLTFDIAPGSGGTGVVETIVAEDPITVDATDPANPVVGVMEADGTVGQAGIVSDKDQVFNGIKTFLDVPRSPNAPLNGDELTNKAYVDTFAAGLQVKAAVRAATLIPGTLASSFENGDIIDGVTLATSDRILIKNQTNAVENGIFTVNVSGAPTRATDYDALGEANVGTFTTITEGGQKNTQWVQVNTGTPTPGTDALNFSRLNISGNVNTIQSPNTAHGTSGTLTGAVKLDSTDIYYSGYTGNTIKQQMVTATAATSPATQIISAPKQFTGVQKSTYTPGQGSSATMPTVIANLSYVDTGLNTKLGTAAAALIYAPIASPTFTGTPKAPTPTAGDSSTNIATTAFVQTALLGVGGGGGGALSKKVTISSAQLLTINSAPVLVIDAPGAGNYIDILSVAYKYNYIAPAYNMNGGVLALITDGAGGRQITWPNSSLLAQTNDVFQHVNTYEASNSDALITNKAVYFEAKTANPTGGNGTIELDIYYRVVSASGNTSGNITKKVHLSSADLLSLSGATPKLCIDKPGVGYAINVLAFAYKYNSVTTDYTNTSVLYLSTKTLGVSLYSIPASVITSGSKFITSPLVSGATSSNLKENEDIVLDCLVSPTLGNGTLDLYITYQIIAL
tara:strand:+ start:1364 stop:3337 length:1974 start_codon:yes stop_codon:yes gene_type:complete